MDSARTSTAAQCSKSPAARRSSSARIVNVLPLPVWPYMKTVAAWLSRKDPSIGATTSPPHPGTALEHNIRDPEWLPVCFNSKR